MKKILFALTAVIATAATAAPTSAALIQKNFVVSGFDPVGPFSKVTVDFDISFDDTIDVQPTVNGLGVREALPNYSLRYAYNKRYDILSVGTDVNTSGYTTNSFKNDLNFSISGVSSKNPYSYFIDYTNGSGNFYLAVGVSVVSKDLAPAVPEPGTWALMVIGFGAVGFSMRRRQKAAIRFA